MQNLMTFSNPDFGEIRTIEENGAVLFCGSDVAKALGYARPNDAVVSHCRSTVKRRTPHPQSPEKDIEMLFISEGDIYRLAARSKLPGAEKFESWIFDEVLPSIRKNGGYISGQSEISPAELLAQALKVADRVLADRDARLAALQPKADYFDALVERNTLTNFRETAKELGASPKKFVAFLLDKKYIYRDQRGKLLPYEAKNDGLFTVKECKSDKTPWSGTQTLITPKGRETFRLLYSAAKG